MGQSHVILMQKTLNILFVTLGFGTYIVFKNKTLGTVYAKALFFQARLLQETRKYATLSIL